MARGGARRVPRAGPGFPSAAPLRMVFAPVKSTPLRRLIPSRIVGGGDDPIFALNAEANRRRAAGEAVVNSTLGVLLDEDLRLSTLPSVLEAYRRLVMPLGVDTFDEALRVLDLAPGASFEEVKARYKALAKLHHPDANGGDKAAEERLKSINQAYTLLKSQAFGARQAPSR